MFFIAVVVNAVLALGLMIKERRLLVGLKNIGRIFLAVFGFRRLDPELTLDNPRALKLRFGESVAIAVVLYSVTGILYWTAVSRVPNLSVTNRMLALSRPVLSVPYNATILNNISCGCPSGTSKPRKISSKSTSALKSFSSVRSSGICMLREI